MFGIEEFDTKGKTKPLAKKLSEIRKTIIEADPYIIHFQDKERVAKFIQDRNMLKAQFKLISDEINNANEFKSKKKRNSLSHLPVREDTTHSEQHMSLEDSEFSKHQFYASNIIDTHIIYGLTYPTVKRLYELIDHFMKSVVSFIKNHVNRHNLSLYMKCEGDNQNILLQLSIVDIMIYREYDDDYMLCSGSQTLIN